MLKSIPSTFKTVRNSEQAKAANDRILAINNRIADNHLPPDLLVDLYAEMAALMTARADFLTGDVFIPSVRPKLSLAAYNGVEQ